MQQSPERTRQQLAPDTWILDTLEVQRATELRLHYTLPGHPPSETEHATAFLKAVSGDDATPTLFYTGTDTSLPWVSIARVLADELLPGGDIGGVASGLKEVITPSTIQEATQTLHDLGYPTLQDWGTEHVAVSVIDAHTGDERGETEVGTEVADDEPSSEQHASDEQVMTSAQLTSDAAMSSGSDRAIPSLASQTASSEGTPSSEFVGQSQKDEASDNNSTGTTSPNASADHGGHVSSATTGGSEVTPPLPTSTSVGTPAANSTNGRTSDNRAMIGSLDRSKNSQHVSQPRRVRGKLRTYVVPEGPITDSDTNAEATQRRAIVDQAGVRLVLQYEQRHGRTPREMEHHQPGYDVTSVEPDGQIRYIEVKSLSSNWSEHYAAGLSRRQWETAQKQGDAYWLYVVERATERDARVYPIRNPVGRVNQFLFDDGWMKLAGEETVTLADDSDVEG